MGKEDFWIMSAYLERKSRLIGVNVLIGTCGVGRVKVKGELGK